MTQPKILIETSVQVSRLFSTQLEQTHLEKQIAAVASQLCSTQYIWMEFQRTVVADYAHIRQLMLNHDGWGDVMAHLLEGQRGFRSRSAVRCTQILGFLYNSSRADWQYARRLTEQMLSRRLRQLFWANVTPLDDSIVCDLVVNGVARQPSGSYEVASSCRKATAMCHLPDFLAENLTELRTLADYLAAHPSSIKDQQRVERLLLKVIKEPRSALGQTSCWPLGDVIIVLQVPSGTALWTFDADFTPLTAALGIPLYDPDASP